MHIMSTLRNMKHSREERLSAFGRLSDVLDRLRKECPWDRKQTNESLRTNTIEEVFELSAALLDDDGHNVCKELGDVLMHVLFYALIGSEKGQFDIADVCNMQADKLIFRHPHIYPPASADGGQAADKPVTAEQVLHNWEQIKLREYDGNKSVLAGVPRHLPSLIKAYRIQDKVRNYGFDWSAREDVWQKVHEEVDELRAELEKNDCCHAEEEFGDLLFSMINAARLYHINPDNALEKTNKKFIRRFNYIEQQARQNGKQLSDLTLEQMDAIWNEAKCKEYIDQEAQEEA